MKQLLAFCLIGIIIVGCGHRKRPTGGPKDTEKPEIISISPDEFSEISSSDIEVIFSKPIERNTIISGLYIYPPILKKKFKWDKNILTIKILETLKDSTNYFFTFTEAIKGEHRNVLNKEYTFTFSSGNLNTSRISGNIVYEDYEDASKPVNLKLMAADSIFILNRELTQKTYELDYLNDSDHIIEAYIDLNKNNSYEYGKEPYCYYHVPASEFSSVDLEMSYEDSLKPELKSGKAIWNNLVELTCSEQISGFDAIQIYTADSLSQQIQIIENSLNSDVLSILTEPLDTLKYNISITGLKDLKMNYSDSLQIIVDGNTVLDSIPPEIISVFPRNGSTIDNLNPRIIIQFSEIILEQNFSAKLRALESGEEFQLELLEKDSDRYKLKPIDKLKNYSSYTLSISISDLNGNNLIDDEVVTFIPIIR
jgi:PBP1b-binding outer membrane lipoprotein LpoB/archaellum component FlaG (FlaF/FlaG flagellin family)